MSESTCTTLPDGSRVWWRDGKLHRDDGPAYEGANGTREWWRDGKLHRDDGPAWEGADGSRAWWRDGEKIDTPTGETT